MSVLRQQPDVANDQRGRRSHDDTRCHVKKENKNERTRKRRIWTRSTSLFTERGLSHVTNCYCTGQIGKRNGIIGNGKNGKRGWRKSRTKSNFSFFTKEQSWGFLIFHLFSVFLFIYTLLAYLCRLCFCFLRFSHFLYYRRLANRTICVFLHLFTSCCCSIHFLFLIFSHHIHFLLLFVFLLSSPGLAILLFLSSVTFYFYCLIYTLSILCIDHSFQNSRMRVNEAHFLCRIDHHGYLSRLFMLHISGIV